MDSGEIKGRTVYAGVGYWQLEDQIAWDHARRDLAPDAKASAFIRAGFEGEVVLTDTHKEARARFKAQRPQHIARLKAEYQELVAAVDLELAAARATQPTVTQAIQQ